MNTRLKQFIAAENISQSQFADNIKVVRASVSHVLSGRNNPGYDFIKAIMTAYPKLNIEWLIMGKGKMYKETSEGNLFYSDEIFSQEEEVMVPAAHESLYETESPVENPPLTQLNNSNNTTQSPINQRRISKIIVFFDDGSYQEMQ